MKISYFILPCVWNYPGLPKLQLQVFVGEHSFTNKKKRLASTLKSYKCFRLK